MPGRWSSWLRRAASASGSASEPDTRWRGSRRAARHAGSSMMLAAVQMTVVPGACERVEQVARFERMERVDPVALGEVAARSPVSRSISASESARGTPSAAASASPTVVLPLPISPTSTMCSIRAVCLAARAGTGRGATPVGRASERNRRAQEEPEAATSALVAGRIETSSSPAAAQARRIVGLAGRVEGREAVDAVRRDDRREDLDPAARCDQRGDPGQRRFVQAEHAAQQRTPRERDGDQVRAARQHRARQALCAGGQEDRVRGTASSGTPGRLGHRGSHGVHADHQGTRLGACAHKHGSAVTGTDIDDHPVGPGDQVRDLADVHLEDATADDLSHGPQSTLGP